MSALLLASATAFGAVKLLGAGYLIYLGLRTLFARGQAAAVPASDARSRSRIFTDGVVINVLNPKAALFFLAFLPQFVDPARGPVTQQVLLLGLLFIGMAVCSDVAYAMLAGSVRHRLGPRAFEGPVPRYVSGTIYVGLGIGAALAGRDPGRSG